MTKWIDKHPALTLLLLIFFGLAVWYGITGDPLPYRISGFVVFLAVLGWFFKKTGYMKEIDKTIDEELEKQRKKTEEMLERRRNDKKT